MSLPNRIVPPAVAVADTPGARRLHATGQSCAEGPD